MRTELCLLGVLLDVTLEVNFSTLRKKTLASLLATAAKAVTTCFGSHACAETVLLLANTL